MNKPSDQITILLLVNDQMVRAIMTETLEKDGYVVAATGDLGVAVTRIAELSPDILVTRTFVAGMPGHQAAKYLRTKLPRMKVLIVGGMLDDERWVDREALEGFEVFPKPYGESELLAKVREVLSAPRG